MSTYNNIPEKNIKKLGDWHYFHIFTDNKDEYIEVIESYNEAKRQAFNLVDKWLINGETNIRVYEVKEYEDIRDNETECDLEDCIFSIGDFPS